MRIIQPRIEFRWVTPAPTRQIETAARVCYKSESHIGPGTDLRMVKKLLNNNHTAMIEHGCMSYHVVCDRGCSHAIVRHRLFSYAQESTQYCNYNKTGEVTFIQPSGLSVVEIAEWKALMVGCEYMYKSWIKRGYKPETARAVLPMCLKTELIITGNFQEWRHFFKLRCTREEQAQIRDVANMIIQDARTRVPVVFDDIIAYGLDTIPKEA